MSVLATASFASPLASAFAFACHLVAPDATADHAMALVASASHPRHGHAVVVSATRERTGTLPCDGALVVGTGTPFQYRLDMLLFFGFMSLFDLGGGGGAGSAERIGRSGGDFGIDGQGIDRARGAARSQEPRVLTLVTAKKGNVTLGCSAV